MTTEHQTPAGPNDIPPVKITRVAAETLLTLCQAWHTHLAEKGTDKRALVMLARELELALHEQNGDKP